MIFSKVPNLTKYTINVVLDKNATIVRFKCTLRDTNINPNDVIGKNWFDIFIKNSDKEKVMEVFNGLFKNELREWKSYRNDILINNQHKLIDFDNTIMVKGSEKLLSFVGVEHKKS